MSTLGAELARKLLHVSMGGFALLLRWLTPLEAAACASAALLFNLFVLDRISGGRLMRDAERRRGFSWGMRLYPAVVLALIAVFHDRLELAAAVWGVLAFGDGMATVVGLLVGGPRLPWNPAKRWSGLIAFVVWGSAAAAGLLRWTQLAVLDAAGGARQVDWIAGVFLGGPGAAAGGQSDTAWLVVACFVCVTLAAFAESADLGVDDNIVVPLVAGAALWCAGLVEPGRVIDALPLLASGLVVGLGVNVALAVGAYALRGVDVSGALAGIVLGSVLWAAGGWRAFSMLLGFFVLGMLTTKLGWRRKASLGIAQAKGGRRGAGNALANAATGTALAMFAVATPYAAACSVALVAAFATAACDTVSSEIGQAFGRRHVLITSLRPVPAGTDGAVSLEGTLAGLLAAAALAGAAAGLGLVAPLGAAVATVAAFAGATIESYLGATVEGLRGIDNEVVNFTNTVIGAGIALGLWALLAG